ncbi:MAG TPA: MogA/MoaB family molybdenum cofactor biosynthesis protein [Solirubrobacterales bacterium]|jgi:molybdopterin adenylyltransferase|nr:MogA/MoaB family molybdenum cofactor biosynthesis protein [Solirubrobacterales bacterium]
MSGGGATQPRGEVRAAVITVSSSLSRGEGEDLSGPALVAFAERIGARVVDHETIPDERELIEGRLRWWSDHGGCELVLTTGGTGFSPDDVTPEATRAAIDREAPGIAEAMRAASKEHTDKWMLSRGVAGTRGRTLIVNFPGNPPSIEQTGAAIAEALPHALALLARKDAGHRHD